MKVLMNEIDEEELEDGDSHEAQVNPTVDVHDAQEVDPLASMNVGQSSEVHPCLMFRTCMVYIRA